MSVTDYSAATPPDMLPAATPPDLLTSSATSRPDPTRGSSHPPCNSARTRAFELPSVVEDVDDGESGRLSVSDLAEHLSERERRPNQSAGDGDVLGRLIVHQQPTALEYLRKPALGLVAGLDLCVA